MPAPVVAPSYGAPLARARDGHPPPTHTPIHVIYNTYLQIHRQIMTTYIINDTHLAEYESMPQVVGESEVAREAVGEGLVEVEHLQQAIPFDSMEVAVGESSHIGCRLAHRAVLPERVAEHVALTCGHSEMTQ